MITAVDVKEVVVLVAEEVEEEAVVVVALEVSVGEVGFVDVDVAEGKVEVGTLVSAVPSNAVACTNKKSLDATVVPIKVVLPAAS